MLQRVKKTQHSTAEGKPGSNPDWVVSDTFTLTWICM